MKRDMDLVREILLKVEESTNDPRGFITLDLPGRSPQEVSYHVMLLSEAGWLEASNHSSSAGYSWKPKRLTWQGHEFLDNARNDTVWNSTKAKVKETVGSASLEVFKGLLAQGVAAALALASGS